MPLLLMGLLVGLVTQYDCPALRAHAIPLVVTGCVSSLPRAHARAHYFAHYLTVTVKIRTLGSIFPAALDGSLVWWDSP